MMVLDFFSCSQASAFRVTIHNLQNPLVYLYHRDSSVTIAYTATPKPFFQSAVMFDALSEVDFRLHRKQWIQALTNDDMSAGLSFPIRAAPAPCALG